MSSEILQGEILTTIRDTMAGSIDKSVVFESIWAKLQDSKFWLSNGPVRKRCGSKVWFPSDEVFIFVDESNPIPVSVVANLVRGTPVLAQVELAANIRHLVVVSTGSTCIYRVDKDVQAMMNNIPRPSDSPSPSPVAPEEKIILPSSGSPVPSALPSPVTDDMLLHVSTPPTTPPEQSPPGLSQQPSESFQPGMQVSESIYPELSKASSSDDDMHENSGVSPSAVNFPQNQTETPGASSPVLHASTEAEHGTNDSDTRNNTMPSASFPDNQTRDDSAEKNGTVNASATPIPEESSFMGETFNSVETQSPPESTAEYMKIVTTTTDATASAEDSEEAVPNQHETDSPELSAEWATSPVPSLTSHNGSEEDVQSGNLLSDSDKDDLDGTSTCFPAAATVTLRNGSVARMDELRIGYSVRVGIDTYSDVIMFTHEKRDILASFVQLRTSDGHHLRVTPSHFIYINGLLRPAREANIGDQLWTLSAHRNDSVVVSIETVMDRGLYNPHTLHGDIMVNGVVASTWTTAVPPKIAKIILFPVAVMYNVGFPTKMFSLPDTMHDIIQGKTFKVFLSQVKYLLKLLSSQHCEVEII